MKRLDKEDDKVVKYEGHCSWWFWSLGDGKEECDYFYDNAKRFAGMHGVEPHELALSKFIIQYEMQAQR